MKKFALSLLMVVVGVSMAMAQAGLHIGPTLYIPTVEVQGAHENGGRGCAGCHAPHSGGRGGGGQQLASNGITANGQTEGEGKLWGTDTHSITNNGTLNFGGGNYPVNLGGTNWSSGKIYQGVATCLSCHDGNVSECAMMSGQAYEQSFGLLNFATNVGSDHQAAPVNLYGSNPIPTLLGNDSGTKGDYTNDHPVGPMANLGAVAAEALGNGLSFTANGTQLTMVITPGTPYANFVAAYGTPAIASLASNNDGIAANQYVVCTTCHNQHQQNVYSGVSGPSPIAGGAIITAQAIFYVNGPYNPSAAFDATHVPSTKAFCLQCHFSLSNQFYGSTTVGVAY